MTSVIIVAAGIGKRMGSDTKKQFMILEGKELIAHTTGRFEGFRAIDEIVLVVGRDDIEAVTNMAEKYCWRKVAAIVEGGKERQDSVFNGIKAVSPSAEYILIHDGVRPFVTEEIVEQSLLVAEETGAAVVGMPVKDTIKRCDSEGCVIETPERSSLWQIQTPQTFKREVLEDVYSKTYKLRFLGTDDASLAEACGYSVKIVKGSYTNIKITTAEDLLIASCFCREGII